MGKLFSTCQLVQEGTNEPELVLSELNLTPGKDLSADRDQNILLTGGFSTISPDIGGGLSPTLFLNYALTQQSKAQLLAIAKAELHRQNNVQYRSYTIDADNRLCVVGDDAHVVKAFIDTYGGILEITPLLVKGYDSEIATVSELQIESSGENYRVSYRIRSAIDLEKCSYCGECGKRCPENCIYENLFIDFNRCTFCKVCETACSKGAVDIHGALLEERDFPALMALGNVKVDESEYVYLEKDLPAYFATLYPCQVDEVITHNSAICQYSGRLGRGCDLCVLSCVHGAVTKGPRGIAVNTMLCRECGTCVSVCPTGALQNERFNDLNFFKFFGDVDLPGGSTVVLGDEEVLHRLWWTHQDEKFDKLFFLECSNIGSLSLFHFLYLFAQGAGRVVVLKRESFVVGEMGFYRQLSFANQIINSLYDVNDAVFITSVEEFFGAIEGTRGNALCSAVSFSTFTNRREVLAQALSNLVATGNKEVIFQPEGYFPFATVTCNEEKCTQCMACLNDCKIGAMLADSSTLQLKNIGAMCVGCGLCVSVCPEDALSISSKCTLNESFFSGTSLAQAEPMACRRCGKVFGTKKSFERVMAILKQKEAVDTHHFEYCEDCRVKNLFEADNV